MHIKIAIKKLVEFVLRSGSIDSRFTGSDRALLGSRIHRKLQKEAGKNYQAEQFLTIDVCEADILYTLHGRADGIIEENDSVTIDEIKTVSTPVEQIDENYSKAHWAQGCFYGYIVCKNENLTQINIQLTYYNIDTEEIKRIKKLFTISELEETVINVLKSYRKWALLSYNWKASRNESLKKLEFPFSEYRIGQRPLAVAVYKTIRDKNRLFACAPTGIGKTMSTVFPSVKAMGEELTDKVFYLTAKTMTATAASGAISLLYEKMPDLSLKTLTVTAKDKVCFLEKRKCDPVSCPYAKDYFDKINDVLYTAIEQNNVFSREIITDIAKQHTLCPYELSLDISEWCDVIICDYNYLFDPQAKLQRFFENRKGEYTFLIDEAHNLPDRAREMYSCRIDKKSFFEIKKAMDKKEKKLIKALNSVNNLFIDYRHKFDELEENKLVLQDLPTDIEKPLCSFVKETADYFDKHKREEPDENLQNLYFETKFFIRILEEYNEKYVTIISKYGDNVVIKLYCTDPSENIDNRLNTGNSAVAFSATLNPVTYYRRQIGGTGEMISVPSPFPRENLGLFVADRISTKYTDREKSLDEICGMLYSMVSSRTGNYIAYFPSYSYMTAVYEKFTELYSGINTTIQQQNMTEQQRIEFISQFDSINKNGLLGFCVMGGIYGEGIDLTGDRLIGCAVVGVGLPQINTQLNTLMEYYDKNGENGFAYAYQYPGMNKVMQAAGRVIRTATDRGVVLLIDSRFTTDRYLRNMPAHWSHLKTVKNHTDLKEKLKIFWNNKTPMV